MNCSDYNTVHYSLVLVYFRRKFTKEDRRRLGKGDGKQISCVNEREGGCEERVRMRNESK